MATRKHPRSPAPPHAVARPAPRDRVRLCRAKGGQHGTWSPRPRHPARVARMDSEVLLLDALSRHEYEVRRYRTRGDARAEQGNPRSSTEYHVLASRASKEMAAVEARLRELLGPDGGPGLPLAGVLKLAATQARALASVDDAASFEDACFYRRHP